MSDKTYVFNILHNNNMPFWYRNECRLLLIEAVVCLLSSETQIPGQ